MRGPLLALTIASVSLACTGIITAGGDPSLGASGATEAAGASGAGGAGTTTTTGTAGTTAAVTGGGGSPSTDGGSTGGDGGVIVGPFDTPVVCTSNSTWTQGRQGSSSMEPGMACIGCHSMGEGPRLALAGTIYPTAHEPDLCNGGNATTGARIVVTGADGTVLTLTPNASGNFRYEGALATPYSVNVTYMGRERVMLERQTSGDCNSCHTQAGAMMAPGRILLP